MSMSEPYFWVIVFVALMELALVIAIIGTYENIKKIKKQNDDMLYYIEKIANAKETEQANSTGWKCPNCGKINQNYVGTCACGKSKN